MKLQKSKEPFAKDPARRCPRCGRKGDMYQRDVMNKLSRAHGDTMICGPCGTEEVLDPASMLRPWKLMLNPIEPDVADRVRELIARTK